MEEFVDPFERAVHDHRAGRLARDVACRAHRHPHGGRREGRGVVDAVADKHDRRLSDRLLHDLQLALGLDARVDLGDSDRVGEPLHLALPVPRDEHHAVEPVGGAEVADERLPVGAWRVAESQERGHASVDHHHALQSAGGGGERGGTGRVGGGEFLAAGDRHVVRLLSIARPLHEAGKPAARLFGEFLHLKQPEAAVGSRLRDGRGERMLRVGLEACGDGERVALR